MMPLSNRLKYALKAPFRLFGLDLIVRRPEPLDFLKPLQIRTVLDVGAHRGVFAQAVRRALPAATIHAFEPLPGPFARLQRQSLADRRLHAWNLAIGSECGTREFCVGASDATSSFLAAGPVRAYFAEAAVVARVQVETTTLDDWSARVMLTPPIFLKADVQGFEAHLLRGAAGLLQRTAVVLLEVSFEELYGGQPLFDDIYRLMARRGFVLQGMIDPIHAPGTGRQLQSNAIFGRAARPAATAGAAA